MPYLSVLLQSVPEPFALAGAPGAASAVSLVAPVGVTWADSTTGTWTPGTGAIAPASSYGAISMDTLTYAWLLVAVQGRTVPVLVREADLANMDTVLGGGSPHWAVARRIEGAVMDRAVAATDGAGSGGGGALALTDGITLVSPTTEIQVYGATVFDDGGGFAELHITPDSIGLAPTILTLQGGIATVVIPAGRAAASVPVVFPTPYSAPPLVVAGTDNGALVASASGVSASGFVAGLTSSAGAVVSPTTGHVSWLASTATPAFSDNFGLALPSGVAFDGSGGMYSADTGNNRVLYVPAGGAGASLVFGQPNFGANFPNNGGLSAMALWQPFGVAVDSAGRLYVADAFNNRVLRYPVGSATPDLVYGQPDFVSGSANNGGSSAADLSNPQGLWVDAADHLYVCDYGNQRVQLFAVNTTTASRTYGSGGGTSATSISNPWAVCTDSTGVYIGDFNRVTYYPGSSTTATAVYGQPNLTTMTQNYYAGPPQYFFHCTGVAPDGAGGIFVTNSNDGTILHFPISTTTPDYWIFNPAGANPSSTSLHLPLGIWSDQAGALYVADNGNSRVLRIPFGAGNAATAVWGQNGSFITNTPHV